MYHYPIKPHTDELYEECRLTMVVMVLRNSSLGFTVCNPGEYEIFERFDRDRSGKIDATELRDALCSLGFAVSPVVLDLLVSKFDKTGGKCKAIEYDNFVKYVPALDSSILVLPHSEGKSAVFLSFVFHGLTEKFKANDKAYNGITTFSYEQFVSSFSTNKYN
ncbi:hypothetical protein Cgig2_013640 [Carnegiea gigantea]|uniref:EF-hand domain-containing protein n=1 Tax=Carnegiea gigantea TaxID=171969 RepID=A0A9Q1KCR7_9CARY|nr:hypothetical protein Cgig2_013640 [Carnegiea gigantea]